MKVCNPIYLPVFFCIGRGSQKPSFYLVEKQARGGSGRSSGDGSAAGGKRGRTYGSVKHEKNTRTLGTCESLRCTFSLSADLQSLAPGTNAELA